MYSQAVTHPSTNTTQRCLTSVIGRELVLSTWYGRRHYVQPPNWDVRKSPNMSSDWAPQNWDLVPGTLFMICRAGSHSLPGPIHQLPLGDRVRQKKLKTLNEKRTGPISPASKKHCPRHQDDLSSWQEQIIQSKGWVSIDRSVVAALPSTTPRPVHKSSTDDLGPPLC